ncbi:MAG: hypothetical protein ABW185_16095, partial [Sedimenticola sp.]
ARLYLQQMKQLEVHMPEAEFQQFTERGYFTIRRTDHFWSGNFTDQIIEQELMRLLKTSGGMTRGRGITDSSLAKWVHALPRCIPICDSLETFTGVHASTADQHRDLRVSSECRDHKDYETFLQWLQAHSPFSHSQTESVVALATGLVADKSVNCDKAFELGQTAADSITDKQFTDAKLKRNDRVKTISGSINTVHVRGQPVVVNPVLLFNRITCVMQSRSEMEQFLAYELAPQPTSLFLEGRMRRTAKSVLSTLLKSKTNPESTLPDNAIVVIDGGYLLHTVIWPPHATYKQVCNSYVSYIVDHFAGAEIVVVFDGYGSQTSTKSAEQRRRASKCVSGDILFNADMNTVTTQESFLANGTNKARLIEMLGEELTLHIEDVVIKQAEADADSLIVTTALSIARSQSKSVVVLGTDTDLLVMLVSQITDQPQVKMLFKCNSLSLYDITEIQRSIGEVSKHLMCIHAITGGSALFGQGKKKAFKLLGNDSENAALDKFTSRTSTKEDVASAGEQFLLRLYGAHKASTLDRYRYLAYNRSISRSSLSSTFRLESLPPTSAAAKQHSYRTYHTVQQWLGNTLPPLEWCWKQNGTYLEPTDSENPIAPEKLLKLVSCGCKSGCGKQCGCRKLGLHCSSLCSQCFGQTCTNIVQIVPDILGDDVQLNSL